MKCRSSNCSYSCSHVWSCRARSCHGAGQQHWNIAARSYPAYNDPNSPYSEMGVDYNSSGDFESAWFNASGTLTPSIGHLIGALPSNGTSSASWTTYFTTETNPVTLAGTGDQLKITWFFTPSGVNSSSTVPAVFRLAVVDSRRPRDDQ